MGRRTRAVLAAALVGVLALCHGRWAPPAHADGRRAAAAVRIGVLEVIQIDDLEERASRRRYLLHGGDGTRTEVVFSGEVPASLRTGMRVRLHGREAGGGASLLVEAGSGLELLQAEATASSTYAAPSVVLVVDFLDASVPCPLSQIEDIMYTGLASVDGDYLESSFGRQSFPADTDGDGAPDVFGPFQVPYTAGGSCDYYGWAEAADQAAAAAGVDLSRYRYRIYVLPTEIAYACNFAGLGNLGCGTFCRSWIAICDRAGTYVHELGHNLGMEHAGTDLDNNGSIDDEYGDASCSMGSGRFGWRQFNAPHKIQMGWVPWERTVAVTESGVHEVALLELDPAAASPPPPSPTQALRVQIPYLKTGKWSQEHYEYFISFRAPLGYDANLQPEFHWRTSVHRVRVRTYTSGTSFVVGPTALVATLGDGESFVDDRMGLVVSQLWHGDSWASVEVMLAAGGGGGRGKGGGKKGR